MEIKKIIIEAQDERTNNNVTHKSCVVCGENILSTAKICKICNIYQDRTRHLIRWGTIIGAIVAIIPLLSGAYSLHKIASVKKVTDIRLIPISCEEGSIVVAAVNKGNQSGIVLGGSLKVVKNNSVEKAVINLYPKDIYRTLVKANDTEIIEFEPKIQNILAPLPRKISSTKCDYDIEIQINGVGKKNTSTHVTFPCLE